MGNRTFFKNAREDKMTLGDIFADVMNKHTEEEVANVFIGGTVLTTPKEEDMLAKWQKPFMFARFFGYMIIGLLICMALWKGLQHTSGLHLMLVGINFIVPVTLMILAWEMNIPRTISLADIFKMMAIGGLMSMIICQFGFAMFPSMPFETMAVFAGFAEEPAKLLLIYYYLSRKDRKYILEGVLIGVAVGTGFAVFESLWYSMRTFAEAGCLNAIQWYVEGGVTLEEAIEIGGIQGALQGIYNAVSRAFSAILGHGIYAGLYGGGLLMAKGSEKISPRHLFTVDFLKYFVLSIALHAYNNYASGGLGLGLPEFFDGALRVETLLEGIIGIIVLLDIFKKGVNQVVKVCADKNGGRVTMAVNRGKSAENYQVARIALEAISGPYMGQTYGIATGQDMTIGRSEGKNNIALPACKNISSMHCQITAEGGQLKVKDLNSTNGTYVGDQKLAPYQERYVGEGMVIYLADKNCGFRVRVQ